MDTETKTEPFVMTGKAILWFLILVGFIYISIWVSTWAWNESLPKMFSGAKRINMWVMFTFMILLIFLGGYIYPRRMYYKKDI